MNSLPEVKRFLKRPGGVDDYPEVKLVWKLHHRPELTATGADFKAIQMDLSGLSYKELHKLFSKHFVRKQPAKLHQRLWRNANIRAHDAGVGGEGVLLLISLGIIMCICVVWYCLCAGCRDMMLDR